MCMIVHACMHDIYNHAYIICLYTWADIWAYWVELGGNRSGGLGICARSSRTPDIGASRRRVRDATRTTEDPLELIVTNAGVVIIIDFGRIGRIGRIWGRAD